jgi:hypothetical protein
VEVEKALRADRGAGEPLCAFQIDGPEKTWERTLTDDIDALYRYLISRRAQLI